MRGFLLHPRQLFGQPRELLVGIRDLFVRMRQPFIGARGQDMVASVDFGITAESIGAPFLSGVPKQGARIRSPTRQTRNEGLTKARPQHEECAASICNCVPEPSGAARRTEASARQVAEHARSSFWGVAGRPD